MEGVISVCEGDCGKMAVAGVGLPLIGEPGLWAGGVPGRDWLNSCGECGREGVEVAKERFKYGGSAEAGWGAGRGGILRESIEVNSRPGSPKEDFQEISNRPRWMMLPGT